MLLLQLLHCPVCCIFPLDPTLSACCFVVGLCSAAADINRVYCEAVGEGVSEKGNNLTSNACRVLRDVIFSTKASAFRVCFLSLALLLAHFARRLLRCASSGSYAWTNVQLLFSCWCCFLFLCGRLALMIRCLS